VQCDFSGGQITTDAGLLPLAGLGPAPSSVTPDWAALIPDSRDHERVPHDSLELLRQRIYQIVAGYEDANEADRLRHDPIRRSSPDHALGECAFRSGSDAVERRSARSFHSPVVLGGSLSRQFLMAWTHPLDVIFSLSS
jgi:hypothetical protein